MSFKILAIRPLKNCKKSFLKNLEINRFYKFYNDYEFFNGDTKIDNYENEIDISDKSITEIKYNESIPENFYGNKINISAVVGKNGSGKSSLLELIYIAFYNLSIENGVIKKSNKFLQISDINLELYFLLEEKIYQIIFSAKPTQIRCFEKDKLKFVLIDDEKNHLKELLDKNSFLYNIVINYSLYGLNSKEVGDWIESIFHKNDGYQTPIVLNPMRTEGNFDINTETDLAKQRFITNLVLNESLLSIGSNKKILNFTIELKEYENDFGYYIDDNDSSRYYDDPDVYFKNYLLKFFFKFNSNELDLTYDGINKILINYILRKLVKITEQYDFYKDYNIYVEGDNITYTINNSKEFYTQLNLDNSHITLKLKQALNFLFFNNLQNRKQNILFKNYYEKQTFVDNNFRDFFEEVNQNVRSKIEFFKNKNNCQAIYFLPPAIFVSDFILDGNYSFSALSSGEKQRIYSLNSILYHLLNLNSVHYNKNAKYKYENLNVILDEIELYYHPEMQINYVKDLIDNVNKLKLDFIKNLNFTFITHSPFILSDIPKQNVLFLEVNENQKSQPKDYENKNTFAGNISELLEDSFFLNDGLVGAFAKQKVEETIQWLIEMEEKIKTNKNFQENIAQIDYYKKIINLIDETVIHYKLKEKFYELFPLEFEEDQKEKELKKLAEELGYKIEKL
ncbi:AAA family ATPase [Chryseobacterium sp. C-71]|uniref:AAA family ATPase n=1 Tax=Chryseobacterium sp. C-71 TaxID=2893882 RepID=UPI001E2D089F|nr:AAA family ATPase [Chryseobacterium sp. C-71]UFH32442.1 AAA family ATPase [Chryseobacterium sp. C-71]